MKKSTVIFGLCILLSLSLVLADEETMFGVGDSQSFIYMPVDYETGFVVGIVSHGFGGGGGSFGSFVNYSVKVTSDITTQSQKVPVQIDIGNYGNPFTTKVNVELINPAGYVVQMNSLDVYLVSGPNVLQQELLMPQIVPAGDWKVRVVVPDGNVSQTFNVLGPGEVKPAPFFLIPGVGTIIFNIPDWIIWLILIVGVIVLFFFIGKKRKRRNDNYE